MAMSVSSIPPVSPTSVQLDASQRPAAGIQFQTWMYKIKHWIRLSLAHAFCLTIAAACIFPLVWMVSSSLKTQHTIFSDMSIWVKHPQWQNYYLAWTKGNFSNYFFNSLVYTTMVVSGVIVIASLAAYAFSRLKFPGKNILFIMLISTMMIPIPGSFIALYVLLVKLNLINTRLGYILPQINGGLALGIFLLKTFFDKLPQDLEDAARIDGCNKFQVYWHVAMPLAKPAVAVLAVFNALAVWNEYLLATLVFSDRSLMPLQRGLIIFQGSHITQYPLLMAGIAISIIPILTLYFLMQRYIVAGITAGALKL
jgi:raffinose/stachyose/melibiose transport system permease protein